MSSLSPDFLEILVCPETKQPLRPATEEELARVNAAVKAGGKRARGGRTLDEPVTEGLVREDGRVLYPVVDGIPVLLIEEGIEP